MDAAITVSHLIRKHLEDSGSYARVLFADFSSAFDTVRPHLLVQRLVDMKMNPLIINWFYSLFTDRSQKVKVNTILSKTKYCSKGVPQGAVSPPLLFTLYANEWRSSESNNYVIKFSDDTIILI